MSRGLLFRFDPQKLTTSKLIDCKFQIKKSSGNNVIEGFKWHCQNSYYVKGDSKFRIDPEKWTTFKRSFN